MAFYSLMPVMLDCTPSCGDGLDIGATDSTALAGSPPAVDRSSALPLWAGVKHPPRDRQCRLARTINGLTVTVAYWITMKSTIINHA